MTQANFGTAYIGVQIDNTKVDQGVRETERKVKRATDRIEKDTGAGILRAFQIGAGIVAGIKAIEVASQGIAGNWERVAEVVYSLPLGIGEAARAMAELLNPDNAGSLFEYVDPNKRVTVESELKRRREEEEIRRAERRATEGAKRLGGLSKEVELLRAATEEEKKRVQIEQAYRDATSGINDLNPDQQSKIRALAEERRRLQLAQIDSKPNVPGFGQEIGARTALSVVPPDKEGPKARQVDITNQYLQNLVQIVARLDTGARAQ